MKITYIVSGFNRSVFLENTAFLLRERGYEVEFIIIGVHNPFFYNFLLENSFSCTDIKIKSWLSYPIAMFKIFRILKRNPPAAVHSHLVTANVLGLTSAFLAGVKHRLYTRHSGSREKGDIKTLIYDRIVRFFATGVIANTKMVAELLKKEGYKKKHIKIINYGFDVNRMKTPDLEIIKQLTRKYNPSGRQPVIGVISRAVEWKGVQYIIPAFQKVLKTYPDALLCLFNFSESDAYSKELNKLLDSIPTDSYIKVAFENNIIELYRIFDVFVHVPVDQYCEAFGQIYIEALAVGIPSIFTVSGIASDFIKDGEHALLVNYRDSKAISESLIRLLKDPELRSRLVEKGQLAVSDRFSLEAYTLQIDNYYKLNILD